MATSFTLGQLTVSYEVKLINCISDTPFDVSDIATVSIEFTKYDGTKFSKPATLVDDTENPPDKLIQYRNVPNETSILDLLGSWTYQGAGVLNDGGNFKTSERKIFWVVP